MTERALTRTPRFPPLCAALFLLITRGLFAAAPTPQAVLAYNAYIATVESRLSHQHAAASAFLAPISAPQGEARLRNGELLVEQIADLAAVNLPGAMLYHWRGTAFAPGVSAADFGRLMKDFAAYSEHFSPSVLRAGVLAHSIDHGNERFRVFMRVRQHHVITIVLDTTYDVTFGRLDPRHGYSISRSTSISEIDSPGTPDERTLSADEDHGFLWRLNTYWSYEERAEGLYMQIETVSLTRSVPPGLAWAVQPFLESVPRESLEGTLRSTCNALQRSRIPVQTR